MPDRISSLAIQRERERDFALQIQQLYPGAHAACFYEDDAVLIDALCEFVRAGLDAGEVAVAILTKPHIAALEKRLVQLNYDLAALKAASRYAAGSPSRIVLG